MAKTSSGSGVQPLNFVRVVLVRPAGPANIGLVARVAHNFGVEKMCLVAPQCPMPNEDSLKFAMAGRGLLGEAVLEQELSAAVEDCEEVIGTSGRLRRAQLAPMMDRDGFHDHLRAIRGRRLALVFGNERDGLNAPEAAACDALLRLDMPGPEHSLNLSHAVALVLEKVQEAFRNQKPEPRSINTSATQGELSLLGESWLGLLEKTHYFARVDRDRYRFVVNQMLRRVGLQKRDLQSLHGVLRHLQAYVNARQSKADPAKGGP